MSIFKKRKKEEFDPVDFWKDFSVDEDEEEFEPEPEFEDDLDYYKDEDIGAEFVFGIKSKDNTSERESSFYTQNDFDIVYQKSSNTYIPTLCLLYDFKNEEEEKSYIKEIFDRFTNWMIETGHDINYKIPMDELVNNGVNFWSEFETLEELYATFKIIVENL